MCGNEKTGGSLSDRRDRYYLAYGSNLLSERIRGRCPNAVYVGRTVLKGWRMLFKMSKTGCFATIEQDANCEVPGIVYKISGREEAHLDRCEGVPSYYYKREFDVKVLLNSGKWSQKPRTCMAYILHEERALGAPPKSYMKILLEAYRRWGFDEDLLYAAIEDSIGLVDGAAYMKNVKASMGLYE